MFSGRPLQSPPFRRFELPYKAKEGLILQFTLVLNMSARIIFAFESVISLPSSFFIFGISSFIYLKNSNVVTVKMIVHLVELLSHHQLVMSLRYDSMNDSIKYRNFL